MKKQGIIGVIAAIVIGAAMFGMTRSPEGSDSWYSARSEIYPQLVPSTNKDKVPIVHDKLSAQADIAYVIDRGDSYDFIMEDQLTDWAITQETLHRRAMRNLEDLAKDTTIDVASASDGPSEKYVIIETTDGYAASRLLSETIRSKVATELGQQYYAATPIRDFLIFWHKDFSLTNQFISQVKAEYESEPTYMISPEIYQVTPSTIEPLTAVEAN